jgi:hypothetical protein
MSAVDAIDSIASLYFNSFDKLRGVVLVVILSSAVFCTIILRRYSDSFDSKNVRILEC